MADHTLEQSKVSFSDFHNVIAGKLRGSNRKHQGVNPSTKDPLWDVSVASAEDLNDAVEAAQAAFKTWSQKPWQERQDVLARIREELLKHQEGMSRVILLECGKPVSLQKSNTMIGVKND